MNSRIIINRVMLILLTPSLFFAHIIYFKLRGFKIFVSEYKSLWKDAGDV